jgi:hypothetical protein
MQHEIKKANRKKGRKRVLLDSEEVLPGIFKEGRDSEKWIGDQLLGPADNSVWRTGTTDAISLPGFACPIPINFRRVLFFL